MKRAGVIVAVLVAIVGFASAKPEKSGADGRRDGRILEFDTMYGVDEAFVGDANPIRGIVGDEAPWTIARSARGRLDTDGHLHIRVRGLVFANDPRVAPGLIGKNDEPTFRGVVSCLSEDGAGHVTTVNVTTMGFRATVSGNSDIDARVFLPQPCVAPIVFVIAGSEDKWFAVTGFESGD